jgi:hypothetical protein
MNWKAGTLRLWIVASAIWSLYVVVTRASRLFWQVQVDELFGDEWLPYWASFTSHVQPYADPTLGMHPNPPGTALIPSSALIAARVGDTLIMAVLPPGIVLLVAIGLIWAAAGFSQKSKIG